jgi:long-chain acyl-CoA synthetase
MSAITGLVDFLPIVRDDDLYIAYLPLAHIMEVMSELAMIKHGVPMGYGNPHTLTNTGIKLAAGQKGDLTILRPTFVVFAPLLLEKIYNAIQSKVASGGWLKQWVFSIALTAGYANFDANVVGAPSFWNNIAFKPVQELVGGRVRLVITGSAPLDGSVHRFIQTVLNAPVRQGYGATETCGASVSQELSDSSSGIVGPPRVCCGIKLVDWDEGGYRWSDKDDPSIGVPRGEIIIGGESVALGYLIDEANPDAELVEKNKTDFKTDENGLRWFHTGDIGQVDADGSIKASFTFKFKSIDCDITNQIKL